MAKISTLAMLFGLLCGLAAPASVSAVLQNQSKPPAAATSPDSDEGQALPISGTWVLPDQHDQGVTFQTKLSFFRSHEENVYTVHEAVQCSRRNKSLSSQAEAPVKATKTEITILEKASHQQVENDMVCQAVITPGTLHYKISADGKTLVLSKPGEAPMTLKREEEQ